jgi:hypothetical protein
MYRNAVDQATRNDIAAAAAAHHELGRDFDGAVAESLIDRIGVEIDKRIDTKLRAGSSGSRSPVPVSPPGRSQAAWAGAGVGAGLTGLVALIADSGSQSKAVTAAVIAVWVILAVAVLAAAGVRWYRGREHG